MLLEFNNTYYYKPMSVNNDLHLNSTNDKLT